MTTHSGTIDALRGRPHQQKFLQHMGGRLAPASSAGMSGHDEFFVSRKRLRTSPYPSTLEKSATLCMTSRISLSSFSRFSRSFGLSAFTVTLSKNASTDRVSARDVVVTADTATPSSVSLTPGISSRGRSCRSETSANARRKRVQTRAHPALIDNDPDLASTGSLKTQL